MLTIEKLDAFGADTASGLARCCGSEVLYLRLTAMVPDEKNFDLLTQAVAQNDLSAAFEASHALKGVLGNLSLTPLYDKVCAITELLRAGTQTDYAPLLSAIEADRQTVRALCNDES